MGMSRKRMKENQLWVIRYQMRGQPDGYFAAWKEKDVLTGKRSVDWVFIQARAYKFSEKARAEAERQKLIEHYERDIPKVARRLKVESES